MNALSGAGQAQFEWFLHCDLNVNAEVLHEKKPHIIYGRKAPEKKLHPELIIGN
jgi:hypothetical protein